MSADDLPLILQIQKEASDNNSSVSGLLRKSKIAATKLGQKDFLRWIDQELEGYKDCKADDLPDYRILTGCLEALNPYQGWQSIQFENSETADLLTKAPVNQGVGTIEPSLQGGDKKSGFFQFNLAHAQKNILFEILKGQYFTDVRMTVSIEGIRGIIEGVRNSILNWSLNLEQAGILGENLEFSSIDKKQAASVSQKITNNTPQQIHATTIGTLIIANDTSNVSNLTNNYLVNNEELKKLILEIESTKNLLPDSIQKEISTPLAELKMESEKPQEKQDPQLISRSMKLIGSICEKAAGSLVAHGIISLISKIAA